MTKNQENSLKDECPLHPSVFYLDTKGSYNSVMSTSSYVLIQQNQMTDSTRVFCISTDSTTVAALNYQCHGRGKKMFLSNMLGIRLKREFNTISDHFVETFSCLIFAKVVCVLEKQFTSISMIFYR